MVGDNEYNLSGVPYSEYKKKSRREYELKPHERNSCSQIKKRVNEKTYTNQEEVREHLEFLENLMGRVKNIIQIEEREGIDNLSLKRDYSKIRMLYNDLNRVFERLGGF